MAKSVKVTFGDVEYDVPRLTIGQLEDLAAIVNINEKKELVDEDGQPLTRKMLLANIVQSAEIVFRRATPKMPDIRELECTFDELREAVERVTRRDGLVKAEPGEAQAG